MMESNADLEAIRKERVKARWSMLRHALLGTKYTPPTTSDCGTSVASEINHSDEHKGKNGGEYSMNSFPGFEVLERKFIPNANYYLEICNEDGDNYRQDDGTSHDAPTISSSGEWGIVRNIYTSQGGYKIQFLTRENIQQHEKNQQHNLEKFSMKERVEALLSHRNHGVDNTGNVRVWDAESTLAGFLLSTLFESNADYGVIPEDNEEDEKESLVLSELRKTIRSILLANVPIVSQHDPPYSEGNQSRCNVLELGAGQAGLSGLAIAAAALSLKTNTTEHVDGRVSMKPLHVVLTDGHPKCVSNNAACVKLLSTIMSPEYATKRTEEMDHKTRENSCDCSQVSKNAKVQAQLLLWDSSYDGTKACCRIAESLGRNSDVLESRNITRQHASSDSEQLDQGCFHICLASDCVHFQDFHEGLLSTIARMLTVGGIALLCQPRRGTSLANFMALIDRVNSYKSVGDEYQGDNRIPLFQMNLLEEFHPTVSKMHRELLLEKLRGQKSNQAITLASRSYDPNWHRPLMLVLKKLRVYDESFDEDCLSRLDF
mmetsp:Transcript_8/g.25  ORF Transcript_8/g.25 Transcript_8/m.25 type:complete len:545 (+) Transcript_8:51-1685(+)